MSQTFARRRREAKQDEALANGLVEQARSEAMESVDALMIRLRQQTQLLPRAEQTKICQRFREELITTLEAEKSE